MTSIGITGSGKSTLMSLVLGQRRYLLVLRSKADTVRYPVQQIARKHGIIRDARLERLEIFPKRHRQAYEFWHALELVFKQGGWTAYTDELFKLDRLGLRPLYEECYTQLRSNYVSMVGGIQRPVEVTRFAIGESSHVISFGLEGRDAKTVAEATSPRMADVLPHLGRHEFVWYYQPERDMFIGKLDTKTNKIEGRYTDGSEYRRDRRTFAGGL